MKKNSSFILSALFAATFINPVPALAVTTTSKTPVMVETKTKVATVATDAKEEIATENKVEYTLPYPGILADHSLYFLKKLRDQILERLISDPLRKIEFYVLQSDKELNSGIFLVAKNKQALASEMFVQTGTYMQKGVKAAVTLKTQGKSLPSYIVERLTNSLAKHEEVLNDLILTSTEIQKADLMSAVELVKKLQGEVGALK